MINVTLFFLNQDEQYRQILSDLEALQVFVEHRLIQVDVEQDMALKSAYPDAPVVQVGPYRVSAPMSRQDLQVALQAARDRVNQFQAVGDLHYQARAKRAQTINSADRFGMWLSKHFMFLINSLVLLYVGLPFMAPVFMKTGLVTPAKIIYTVYSPLCHQLSFRSFYLFGEQPYYPRELAGIPGMISYEEITKQKDIDLIAARSFIGNETMGYKVALCERDVAIYGGIFIFGLVFVLTKRKIKTIPWYYWILLGLFPVGLDGFSQLPGLLVGKLPDWVVLRESTPLLRVITGALFGITTAWYVYPIIQETMNDTRQVLLRKNAISTQEQRV